MDLYEACICYFLCNMDPSILLLSTDFDLYENWELPGVQDGFRKGSRIRDQIANICWVIEKEREFQKNIYFCFTDYAKTFDCVDHTQKKKKKKVENSYRDGNTRPSYLHPEKSVCRSRKNS